MRALAVVTSAIRSGAGLPARHTGSWGAWAGRLVKGGVADLCIFDPTSEWTINPCSTAKLWQAPCFWLSFTSRHAR
jgi:dihydroorotase